MEQGFQALRNENYQLREYILTLQSRLLESSSDFPPAPSHTNLPAPHKASGNATDAASAVEQQLRREMQHQGPSLDAMSQLQAAAAQASEARPQEAPYGLGERPKGEEAKPSS